MKITTSNIIQHPDRFLFWGRCNYCGKWKKIVQVVGQDGVASKKGYSCCKDCVFHF